MAKKNKQPKVRHAKPGDRNLFKKLWMEYLISSHESGDSEVIPNENNLEKFCIMFDLYTSKDVEGIVLFVGDYAVLMWGSIGVLPFDAKVSQRAMGWGTYIKPSYQGKGISKIIRRAGIEELKKMGFQCIFGEVKHKGNDFEKRCKSAESIGFKPYATTYIMYLEDEEIK